MLSKDQKKKLELKERPDTGIYVTFFCNSIKVGMKNNRVMVRTRRNLKIGRRVPITFESRSPKGTDLREIRQKSKKKTQRYFEIIR